MSGSPRNAPTALELRSVSRAFGGLIALHDVSFSLSAGEIVGLIGPNGAGKSTLFEIISGNLRPTGGQVVCFDDDYTQIPAYRRRRTGISRTFQKVRLFETMTVAENVELAASQCARSKSDYRRDAEEILGQLRLESKAGFLPSELTLADRKRVEIGRAIAGYCRLLMLDESLSGLTHDEAREIGAEILELNRTHGVTVVIVEHVLSVLAAMVKRLIVLHHGTVIADGTPGEVAHNPAVIEAYLGTKQKVFR